MRLFAATSILIIATFVFTGCEKDEPSPQEQDGPFFHLRYCEVLMASQSGTDLVADVYNTLGCNSCPQTVWDTMDYTAIAEEYNAFLAVENGPRYWVLDSIDGSQNPSGERCADTIGGLAMTRLATVTVAVENALNPFYIPSTVDRNTVYYFNKGREVYQLRSATDSCYIMQSYSLQNDSTLALNVLPDLPQRIALPTGWSFTTRTLEAKFMLPTKNGEATLVSDDLRNSYQYLHTGCLD